MDIRYTATAVSTGNGRRGHVRTDDGILDLDLRSPVSMGGPGGATNPEQLFAAGYSACFHSACKSVAARGGLDLTGSEITARVGIGANGAGGYGLSVELELRAPALDRSMAEALMAKADAICPYSNATRGNIPVALCVV